LRAGVLQRMLTSGAIVLALAMPVRAETLEQALIEAYQNNPQLNSQRTVVRETDETIPQALSGFRPTVRVTGTVGQEYTSVLSKTVPQNTINPVTAPNGIPTYQRNGFGYSPNNISATATQTLYNGFQTGNRTRQAESNTSAARETLRVAEQTILLNAATAYMDLLRDGALLEVQRRNVEVLQEQLRQTRDRFIVGEVTRTDVAQAEASLAQGRAAVLTAESRPSQSRSPGAQQPAPHAHAHPQGPAAQIGPLGLVERVRLLGVVTFGGPLGQVARPATAEEAGAVRVVVELQHVGHRAMEEGAVVRDDHHPTGGAVAPRHQ